MSGGVSDCQATSKRSAISSTHAASSTGSSLRSSIRPDDTARPPAFLGAHVLRPVLPDEQDAPDLAAHGVFHAADLVGDFLVRVAGDVKLRELAKFLRQCGEILLITFAGDGL